MKTHGLTPQQFRVAELVANGLTDKEIAGRLTVSRSCIAFHVRRIALRWNLDKQRDARVQITRRILGLAA